MGEAVDAVISDAKNNEDDEELRTPMAANPLSHPFPNEVVFENQIHRRMETK